MPTDALDPDVQRFPAALDALMRDWLRDGGCPCRFPRFRATVERDVSFLGATLTTWEQDALVTLFDGSVKLENVRRLPSGREGTCERCGATIHRTSHEPVRDQWIERMRVVPRVGVADLGAAVDGPVPHCWPFFTVGGGDAHAKVEAEIQFPRLGVDAWLAWMRELRD